MARPRPSAGAASSAARPSARECRALGRRARGIDVDVGVRRRGAVGRRRRRVAAGRLRLVDERRFDVGRLDADERRIASRAWRPPRAAVAAVAGLGQLRVGRRLLGRAEDAHHRHVGNLLAAGGAGLLRGHDGRTSITDISRRAAIRYPARMLVLGELKTQALRYVVLGDLARAFRTYEAIVRAVPSDLDARMKVADLCVTDAPARSGASRLRGGRVLRLAGRAAAARARRGAGAALARLRRGAAARVAGAALRIGLAAPRSRRAIGAARSARRRCRRRRCSTSRTRARPRTPPPRARRRRRA